MPPWITPIGDLLGSLVPLVIVLHLATPQRTHTGAIGCNPQDRATFNRNLIQLFSEEYARIPKPTPPTYPGAPKGLPIESGSDALLDTPEKRVIEWKFSELDDNKDNQLRRKEIRSLKRMVKKLVKPKPCAKTFYEYCDIDNNRRIARSEWSVCLGVDTNNGHPDSTGAHADSSSYNTQNSRNNGDKRRRKGRRRQRGDRSRSNGRRRDGRRRSNGRTRDGGSAADGGSLLESPFTAPHLLRPSSQTADETADGPSPTLYSERDGESSRQPGEPQDDIMIMKLTPQDDDGGDSANDEGSTIRNCQDERRKAEENDKNDPEGHIFIPNCAPGHSGHYMPAQCHDNYCWCVTVTTGKPIRGTSSHMVEPDCTNVRPKDYKGCPYSKKKKFLVGLLDEMTTEMMEFASNTSNTRRMPEPNPNHTMEEEVVRWKLWHLDLNNNGVLEKREWNSFKQLVKTEDTLRGHLRKCSRNFIRFCDANEDKSIDMEEWLECMGINEQKQRGNLPDNPKRKGPNPFSKYLRS